MSSFPYLSAHPCTYPPPKYIGHASRKRSGAHVRIKQSDPHIRGSSHSDLNQWILLRMNLRSRVIHSIGEYAEQYERHRHDKKTEGVEIDEAHDARSEEKACMGQISQKEALP